uniref:Uncharacterized protein n=1 Tax=Kalanchoe fedtschenkoi TaxID=63787 RepID=A0A7N0VKJ9_KALFE
MTHLSSLTTFFPVDRLSRPPPPSSLPLPIYRLLSPLLPTISPQPMRQAVTAITGPRSNTDPRQTAAPPDLVTTASVRLDPARFGPDLPLLHHLASSAHPSHLISSSQPDAFVSPSHQIFRLIG